MPRLDRRSFIAGAVAAIFAGISPEVLQAKETPKEAPIDIDVVLKTYPDDPLWHQIFREVVQAYAKAAGRLPGGSVLACLEELSNTIYLQITNIELLIGSVPSPITSVRIAQGVGRDMGLAARSNR